jgi:hypothetical protein
MYTILYRGSYSKVCEVILNPALRARINISYDSVVDSRADQSALYSWAATGIPAWAIDTLNLARKLQSQGLGNTVVIVSESSKVLHLYTKSGIKVLSVSEALEKLKSENAAFDSQLFDDLTEDLYKNRSIGVIIIVGLLLLLTWALIKSDAIGRQISLLSPIIVAASTCIAGAILYWFRSQRRLAYGIAEIGVGVLIATLDAGSNSEPNYDIEILKLLSALYIVVRGFDNVTKGLRDGPFTERWKQIFPNS